MSNRLKNETSPYLVQHAENPVDWYPWCDEAFAKAKQEDKPIFLSIGYSTCHWCHVMGRESFEDMATAKLLNEYFVCIKVDREERPDVDSVYMSVCQALTGGGGWPLSIFMTPDKQPFFAGTYFPPKDTYGMPAFSRVLQAIIHQWKKERKKLFASCQQILDHLRTNSAPLAADTDILADTAAQYFVQCFDAECGGFGREPKFPTPHNFLFLMLYSKHTKEPSFLKMVKKTLLQMRKGGIFDQIGYGFCRYSTDRLFLVPHFEKMLYDNALLIIAYTVLYGATEQGLYLDTAKKTAAYILREMTDAEGGFYSAQDADSQGVEGKYYTFSFQEILDVLGQEQGLAFAKAFDITQQGNFEGSNIPNLLNGKTEDYTACLEQLYLYRKNRYPLHTDDKILLSWNALMITALCLLYRMTHEEAYLAAARKAQKFLENHLCKENELYTSFRAGKHTEQGFLDDYAFYICALIHLYEASLQEEYLDRALQLCSVAIRRFADDKEGYFLTDENALPLRPKETYDGALPSGNSMMAYDFVKLYQLTDQEEYRLLAQQQFAFLAGAAYESPQGHCMFLLAKQLYDHPLRKITVVLRDQKELPSVRKKLPFDANLAVSTTHPLLDGKTTYYVCNGGTCYPPTTTI